MVGIQVPMTGETKYHINYYSGTHDRLCFKHAVKEVLKGEVEVGSEIMDYEPISKCRECER